jgi:serine/threonine-protein kinase
VSRLLTGEFNTGQRFGAYELGPVLGRGGMGVVYRAQHVHLGRTVALKLLAPELSRSEDFRARFLRESRLAAELEHPGIVTVYDAGEVNGVLFIAMRFVRGTDLAALLAQRAPLGVDETLSILGQVAGALDAAHAAGLVHRDVKPANVMIEGQRCYLADFGLTKRLRSSDSMQLTAAGQFLGTVDYVAPEQIEGRPTDGRADQYALGCVLFECLTGSRPYPRDSQVAVIFAQLREPPPRPCELRPDLPAAIDTVVAKAMAKDPLERYATCDQFVAAAVAALSERTTTAPREDPLRAPTARADAPPPADEPRTAALPAERAAPPVQRAAVPTPGRGEPGAAFPTAVLPPAAGAPPAAARARKRFPLIPVAALVLLVAVGVAIALVASGGGRKKPASAATPAGAVAGGPHVVGDPIRVGGHPLGVAFRGGAAWVADSAGDSVTRVDAATGATTSVRVGTAPFDLGASSTAIWAANSGSDSVTRIDLASGRASPPFPVGHKPLFVTTDGSRVYVANSASDSVTVLDSTTGARVGSDIRVGNDPRGITGFGPVAWVTNYGDDTVSEISNGKVVNTIPVGRHPVGITHSSDSIWITNQSSDTVSRIRLPVGRSPVTSTTVGRGPYGIIFGEGYVWVTNRDSGSVTRIDPKTGKVVGAPIPVPGEPVNVAARLGSVWVTSYATATLTRIKP